MLGAGFLAGRLPRGCHRIQEGQGLQAPHGNRQPLGHAPLHLLHDELHLLLDQTLSALHPGCVVVPVEGDHGDTEVTEEFHRMMVFGEFGETLKQGAFVRIVDVGFQGQVALGLGQLEEGVQKAEDFYLEAYARADSEADRAGIENDLWEEFGVEEAVFVLDMVGFTRIAQDRGLVHYLSMIQRMRMTIRPIIENKNGHIVKFEADNCFARFADPLDAIKTAITYKHVLKAMNLTTPEDLDIHTSIGIDYGKFLLVKKTDFYGTPVNVASKLGEDIAKPGEILVSANAMERVSENTDIRSEAASIKQSNMEIFYHKIQY